MLRYCSVNKWSHKHVYYFCVNPECKTLPANSIGIFKYLWAEIRIRKEGDKASQNWKNGHLEYC